MCVRERNQCNTIECSSVGGHTLSSKLPSTASSPASQKCLDEILKERDRSKREGEKEGVDVEAQELNP